MILYYSENGNDTNPGTATKPLKHLNYAIKLARQGDSVVYLPNALYDALAKLFKATGGRRD